MPSRLRPEDRRKRKRAVILSIAVGIAPGTVLNGKYRIVRQLDARGIGALYECRNVRGDARVAVKVMRKEFAANQE